MRQRAAGRVAYIALVATTWMLAAAPCVARAAAVSPVVAGYHRLKDDAKAPDAAAGELLLAELNCTACHTPDGNAAAARVAPKGAPDLSELGAPATPQWVRAYLAGPHTVKPGATMPDVLHALEPAARGETVEAVTHFLASLGGPVAPSDKGGNVVLVERGRTLYHSRSEEHTSELQSPCNLVCSLLLEI